MYTIGEINLGMVEYIHIVSYGKTFDILLIVYIWGGCRGRDRMVVGFATTGEIIAYHH